MAGDAKVEYERIAYALSHDISAPIRQMRSFATLLQEDYAAELPPQAQEFLGHLQEGGARAHEEITALVRYLRLCATPAECAPVELSSLFAAAEQELDLDGHELRVDSMPAVLGDVAQLERLVVELLSNALKFRGEGAAQIRVTGMAEEGHLTVVFLDRGVGFRAEDVERMFQLFRQLHPRGDYPGVGVGLAHAQQIARNHQSELTALREDSRTSFSIRLKLASNER